jgi:hypothetical protein
MQYLFYVRFLLLVQLAILGSFPTKICKNMSVSFGMSVLMSLGHRIVTWEQQNGFALNLALGSFIKIYWRLLILVKSRTGVTDATSRPSPTCNVSRAIFTAQKFFRTVLAEKIEHILIFPQVLTVDEVLRQKGVNTVRSFTTYTLYSTVNNDFVTHAKLTKSLNFNHNQTKLPATWFYTHIYIYIS